ncbi:unnamed protein product [Microthlaspi erraticum]|uniref:Uncharacterized protein n=1 Tax=Microthlaspi erraticum TaxID=1685480 RepID=A0A6D2JP14_9BRAS|nr:unnamed protein product [Microthlaspi erraticum]
MSRASSHFCDLDFDNDEEDEEKDEFYEKPQQPPVPKKRASRLSIILLDQELFTVYKRLFVLSLFLNVVALVLAATGHFAYARYRAALFSIANILALTLCRSEAFLRLVFYLTVKLLGRSFIPLRVKTAVTSLLQSLGVLAPLRIGSHS